MSQTNPPPVRVPAKLLADPELREFFLSLTRSLYLIWENSRNAELTAALTSITHTAPGVDDYAIQNLSAGGFGFATANEGNTVLKVVANLQTRVNEIEDKLTGG